MQAHRAVDGNFAADFYSCAITAAAEPGQWWYVDFGGLYAVYNLTVYPTAGNISG